MAYIRPAVIEDLHDIHIVRDVALHLKETPGIGINMREIHQNFRDYGGEDLKREWYQNSAYFWVMESDRQEHPNSPFTLCGRYMIGMYSQHSAHGNMVIDNIYALPTRHNGGRVMMTHAICVAQKTDVNAVEINARSKMSAKWCKNIALFDFVPTKERKKDAGAMILYQRNFEKSLRHMGLMMIPIPENQ